METPSLINDLDPATRTGLVLSWCAVFGAAAWGWGRLVLGRIGGAGLPVPWTAALGLAVLIAVGGLLNLIGLARPLAFDLLILTGLALAAWGAQLFGDWRASLRTARWWRELIWALPLVVLLGVLAWKLTPPAGFNYHDDFEKYLVHPKRMLETGSVAGGPFSAVGAETLGAMAYLQGFVAAHAPLSWVGALDAVFSFGLCLAMIGSACARWRVAPMLTLLVIAAVAAINPQVVNVTAVYTGIVLLLLIMIGPLLRDASEQSLFPRWLGIGYAALLGLKTSFMFVLILHLGVLLVIVPFLGSLRQRGKELLAAAAAFAVALLPWLLATLPWMQLGLGPMNELGRFLRPGDESLYDPLSTQPIFYGFGESWLHYTLLMLLVVALGGFRAHGLRHGVERTFVLAATLAGPLSTATTLGFFSVAGLGHDASLRYMSSSLIASTAACLLALLYAGPEAGGTVVQYSQRRLAIVFAIAVLGGFFKSAEQRFRQIAMQGVHYGIKFFVTDASYRTYVDRMLGPDGALPLQAAQRAVPVGSRVLAMTPLAFQIDYARNQVHAVNPWFLLVPWLNRPATNDVRGWHEYLERLGIQYLLVQYQGYAVRSGASLSSLYQSSYLQNRQFAVRLSAFNQVLNRLAASGERVYDDGAVFVARLPPLPRGDGR